jgi:hypothetical protein
VKKYLVLAALVAGCAAAAPQQEALSDDKKAAVRVGMTVAEVEQLLGKPGSTETYKSGETVSGWRMPGKRPGVRNAWFNVHYRDGKVVKTSESFDYIG